MVVPALALVAASSRMQEVWIENMLGTAIGNCQNRLFSHPPAYAGG